VTRFGIYTIENAPEASRPLLKQLQEAVGFLPNLAATMAESPALLEAFTSVRSIYARTTLSGVEREIVALTTAVENGCMYCAAVHSTLAAMHGASEAALDAVRAGDLPSGEPRLGAVSTFARQAIQSRGAVTPEDISAVLAAGFTKEQVLDVFVGIAMTNLASQMHHVSQCAVDPQFAARAWTPPAAREPVA
jgi:uncharacterized peroxidase-related enzyme